MTIATTRTWGQSRYAGLGISKVVAVTTVMLASTLWPASPAQADDYPSRPIRLIVPFPVGGSSDNMGRMLSDKLATILKQPVVIENKAGAGGMIGTDAVAKSAADGYSLVLVDVFHTTTPVYTRKMPYDAVRDFTPVSLIARSPLFLVSSPAFEPRTLRDFVAYARANPHKTTMAIAGTGSVVTDLFRARSQLQLNIVPYKGAAPAIQDLMAGQVNAFISTMASAIAQVLIMPEVRERLASLALEPASGEPQEMQRKVEGDFVKWQALARELDINPID